MIKTLFVLKKKRDECKIKHDYIYRELVCPLENFISKYKYCFINNESIEAVSHIITYLEKLNKHLDTLDEERASYFRQLNNRCKHEIIIECPDNDSYSKRFCPICGIDYSITKDNTVYVFECPKTKLSKCESMISNFLNENMDNDNLLDDLEDYLEDFENEGIIVRRDVYEKKRTN